MKYLVVACAVVALAAGAVLPRDDGEQPEYQDVPAEQNEINPLQQQSVEAIEADRMILKQDQDHNSERKHDENHHGEDHHGENHHVENHQWEGHPHHHHHHHYTKGSGENLPEDVIAYRLAEESEIENNSEEVGSTSEDEGDESDDYDLAVMDEENEKVLINALEDSAVDAEGNNNGHYHHHLHHHHHHPHHVKHDQNEAPVLVRRALMDEENEKVLVNALEDSDVEAEGNKGHHHHHHHHHHNNPYHGHVHAQNEAPILEGDNDVEESADEV